MRATVFCRNFPILTRENNSFLHTIIYTRVILSLLSLHSINMATILVNEEIACVDDHGEKNMCRGLSTCAENGVFKILINEVEILCWGTLKICQYSNYDEKKFKKSDLCSIVVISTNIK